jgi:UDP:flavonoid glycosyltransferase YjiC (YdhE family)
VPYRFVAYTPSLFVSRAHPAPLLPAQTWPGWANLASWWLFKTLTTALVRGDLNRERAALGMSPVRDVYRHFAGDEPWIAADPLLAPVPDDIPFPARAVGFLYDRSDEPLPEKLEAFLAAGPPPVYLGFGSMTDRAPEETTRQVVSALEQIGCRAVLGRGWAGLGSGPLPESVFACGSVSHTRLFPRLAAVVHHGGSGTTAAASLAGVPQLVVPHAVDQFYWAHRVHVSGAGLAGCLRRRLTAARLAELLGALLESEWTAQRARELGEQLRANARAHRQTRRTLLD